MLAKLDILNRLRIWQKLAVVGLAFSVPLGLTTFFLLQEKSIKIEFARAELYGDEYLRPCARLLVDAVRHKTAARRRLLGDVAQKQTVLDLESSIERDLRELEVVDRRLASQLQTTQEGLAIRQREMAHPSQIRATWDRVMAASSDLAASDNLHAKLVMQIRLLLTHVGDSSKLILDPDIDTYYTMDALLLREPELIDRLGRLADAVDDMTRKSGAISLIDRTGITSGLALLQFHVDGLVTDATTAINEAPNFSKDSGIEQALGRPSAEVTSAFRTLADLTASGVVEPPLPALRPGEHPAAVARALDSASRYWADLFNEEDVMLGARMAGDLQRRSVALWSVLVAVTLTVVLTVFILRSITGPIAKAAAVADQLARGELPDEVEVGSATDETGRLLAAINKMLKYLDLRRTIDTLKESAELLTTAMTELETQAVENERAITRQAAALQETQVTSQQIKQTSRLAAEKAEGVLQIAERAEETSRSGESSIERSLSGLAEIKTQAEQIAAKIADLNERTQQIGTITQTVKDLADQSNMLALNAAIEAVRSGEHGKGFGVVAREIRSLADQSIQATNRVNEILDSVASSIRTAVALVERGGQRMEAGLLEVRTSGDSLRTLSHIVHESSQSARQIAAAVSQQDAGIGQVFRAISEQSTLMDETVKRAEGTRSAIGTVKRASDQVAALARRYRTT